MRFNMVELSEHPLDKDEYLEDYIILEGSFVPEVAEYVETVEEDDRRAENIADFLAGFPPDMCIYDKEKGTIIFKEGIKEKYFEQRYTSLKSMVSKLSFDDFISEDGFELYRIRKAIINRMDDYVYETEDSWKPLDTFVRELSVNTEYYIGGVLSFKM